MKLGIVKLIDGTIYKFENPMFFDVTEDHKLLAVLTDEKDKVFFPLYNVLSFSLEE